MAVVAYVRVSDEKKQTSLTQKHVIYEYAEKRHLLPISTWHEFYLSGYRTTSCERGIDELISNLNPGDVVLVSDISRLGRESVHDLLHIITSITKKGCSLHLCYSRTVITPNDTNDISMIFLAIGEAFAAVKFSEERSRKAKAAIERRKLAGLQNGRKHGAIIKSKLDPHVALITKLLDNGESKASIFKILLDQKGIKISRPGFNNWIDSRLGGKYNNKKKKPLENI